MVAARGWAANSLNARVRLTADNDQLKQEIQRLREELRVKNARLAKINPRWRPHYPAVERMAILELKAARGWSLAQAGRAFLVEPHTIASWLRRIDEDGFCALVQLREPVNKFSDFVRYIVQRLKTLCPALGKAKLAQILARAGLIGPFGVLLDRVLQVACHGSPHSRARHAVARRAKAGAGIEPAAADV